jgi:hypothetical protein
MANQNSKKLPWKKMSQGKIITSAINHVNHWIQISKEQLEIIILENSPKIMLQLELDYYSLKSSGIFNKMSEVTYPQEWSCKNKNRKRNIEIRENYILKDFYKKDDVTLIASSGGLWNLLNRN